MGKEIKVLVVDDSRVIREMIADKIEVTDGMVVLGTASGGKIALQQIREQKPDIVTLDIQMPVMDGLQTLDAILLENPVPVVMVSSLTQRGADVTLDALDRGAMDYVGKPGGLSGGESPWLNELATKIRAMAGADVGRMIRIRKERAAKMKNRRPGPAVVAPTRGAKSDETQYIDKCIAIGISTGGPPALTELMENLQTPLPPIVIVQHMPADFTKPFANRLNGISALTVKEAATGDVLRPNCVYVAQGGKHLQLASKGKSARIVIRDGEPVSGHRPSVDVMMTDAANIFGDRCLGIVMTGMGRDGSDGCGTIRAAGGYVLGQDESTSDVYGMNKVAYVEGNVDRQFRLDQAANIITIQVQRMWRPAMAK